MPTFEQLLLSAFGIVSLGSFLVYGFDKFRAKTGGNRVSEKTLLIYALIGPLGAVLGVLMFNHKSSKHSYMLKLIPVLFVSLGLWGAIYYLTVR